MFFSDVNNQKHAILFTDSMKPLCLPVTSDLQRESLIGQNAVVAGWGVTEEGLESSVLLSVDLPVISNSDCMSAYRELVLFGLILENMKAKHLIMSCEDWPLLDFFLYLTRVLIDFQFDNSFQTNKKTYLDFSQEHP